MRGFIVFSCAMLAAIPILAQGPPPPSFPPQQQDSLVARVAQYPD
jgi:hypothetical protein